MKTTPYNKLLMLLLTVLMVFVPVACNDNAATETEAGTGSDKTNETVTEQVSETDRKDSSGHAGKIFDEILGERDTDIPDTAATISNGSTDTPVASDLDIENIFSERDLRQSPDLSEAELIIVSDNETLTISEEGIYQITGTATNATILVEADKKAKVQLILDNVNITNDDFPAIYIVSADKCFVTLMGNSTLSVTGTFRADGDTNTDAVIFSKEDLTLNGTGSLTINSAQGNGVSCKDDLVITGGTYAVTTALDSFEANDSIAIADGTFTIATQKDGFHSENDSDNTLGFIFIQGGTFTVNAKSDGIQGTTFVRIDGGTFKITGSEGIEATYILINDGELDVYGSDDGLNASRKSKAIATPTITVNGGHLKVEVGPGDTDAIDANGDIYVNGGTIEVTSGMSSFDYDSKAVYNGGTIIINGEQVDSIPESMMPGFGGFGGRPDGGNGGRPNGDTGNGGRGRGRNN